MTAISYEKINEFLRTVERLYPDKRKLFWYMQPHIPFLDSDISKSKMNRGGENEWDKLRDGKVSLDKFISHYDRNIEYARSNALNAAEEIFNGRTVITSDHGNFLGESGFYGHTKGGSEKPVRKVPLEVVSS